MKICFNGMKNISDYLIEQKDGTSINVDKVANYGHFATSFLIENDRQEKYEMFFPTTHSLNANFKPAGELYCVQKDGHYPDNTEWNSVRPLFMGRDVIVRRVLSTSEVNNITKENFENKDERVSLATPKINYEVAIGKGEKIENTEFKALMMKTCENVIEDKFSFHFADKLTGVFSDKEKQEMRMSMYEYINDFMEKYEGHPNFELNKNDVIDHKVEMRRLIAEEGTLDVSGRPVDSPYFDNDKKREIMKEAILTAVPYLEIACRLDKDTDRKVDVLMVSQMDDGVKFVDPQDVKTCLSPVVDRIAKQCAESEICKSAFEKFGEKEFKQCEKLYEVHRNANEYKMYPTTDIIEKYLTGKADFDLNKGFYERKEDKIEIEETFEKDKEDDEKTLNESDSVEMIDNWNDDDVE